MKLYVCMVLGGSIDTLLYIFFNCVLPYEFGLKWKSIFIKINIMFYLLPLPFIMSRVKGNLRIWMERVGIYLPSGKIPDVVNAKNVWESVVIKNADGRILYITGYQNLLIVIAVISGMFLLLIAGWVTAYFMICHRYKRDIINLKTDEYLKNMRWHKRIHISVSEHVASPVTIGLLRPTIIFPANRENYEAAVEGIIQHELTHIGNLDALFRFLTFAIVAMQWYNPLAYYLLQENIAVGELLCDKVATEGMTKDEKTCYMRCIIDAVEKTKISETLIMTLGAPKELSKRRMKMIMGKNEKKIWKRSLAAGILILCFIVSSIPALAYKEPRTHAYDVIDVSKDWALTDKMEFALEGTSKHEEISIEFGLNDGVFVSEAGETYFYNQLYEGNQMRAACQHTFQVGTYSDHDVKSDGGCVLVIYNAERCSKCGDLKIGSKKETRIYEVCPH